MTTKHSGKRAKVQPPAVPLAALRKSHGLKQPEVLARIAEMTGRKYTVGALSAVENGLRGISAQFLDDIAAVYGLDADDLWTTYTPRQVRDEVAA